MARSAERARAVFGSDVVPPRNGGGGVPPDGRDGRGAGNNTPTPAVGLGVTWTIGLILIPCAILFLLLLLQLWPPPKPRGSLTIAFQKSTLEVRPGNPAIYTVFIRAPSSFPGSATLEAVILPDDLTYAFAPPGTTSKTGALVPSPAGSSAALTLQTLPGEEKHYSIMVAATGGGQTKTITGRLVVRQDAPEASEAQTRDMSEEHAFREGFSELTVFFWTFPHVPDEVRLFLIVAVVGCLGGLLHSIRSFIWYAGHAGLERHWIPFYATTPIVGMTTAILFYLSLSRGFHLTRDSRLRDQRLWLCCHRRSRWSV